MILSKHQPTTKIKRIELRVVPQLQKKMKKTTKTNSGESKSAGFQVLVKPYAPPQKPEIIIPRIPFEHVLRLWQEPGIDKWHVEWNRLVEQTKKAGKAYFVTQTNGVLHSTKGNAWNRVSYKNEQGKETEIRLSDTIGFKTQKPLILASEVLIPLAPIGEAEDELSWSCYARRLKYNYYGWESQVWKIQDGWTTHPVEYLTENLEIKALKPEDLIDYKAPTKPITFICALTDQIKPLVKKYPRGRFVVNEHPEDWELLYWTGIPQFRKPGYQARFSYENQNPRWNYQANKKELVDALKNLKG